MDLFKQTARRAKPSYSATSVPELLISVLVASVCFACEVTGHIMSSVTGYSDKPHPPYYNKRGYPDNPATNTGSQGCPNWKGSTVCFV